MSLPELIEIVPLETGVRTRITLPGSKSITNRALVLAALADGETVLRGALWSDDTQVMVDCLQELGFMVNVARDPAESCNRTITVYGKGGHVPPGGSAHQPLELFVGNAGTTARFLAAMVCLGHGAYRISGVPRMHERPQRALFAALRTLGYGIDADQDRLPAVIHGCGPRAGQCEVSIVESSQFASALLLAARHGGWNVQVVGENADESPYVRMTLGLIDRFAACPREFRIEPDASSGSYFIAVDWLLRTCSPSLGGANADPSPFVQVGDWPASGWQVDAEFPRFLPLPPQLSRMTDLGDSIMTAIVLAPFAQHPVQFRDLGRLRLQECERVAALRSELERCGATVEENGDSLLVHPGSLHGAVIETFNDHRMAMAFATLGVKVPQIKITNPLCVGKTFPGFFRKLADPPPTGLGVRILDGVSGRPLELSELAPA